MASKDLLIAILCRSILGSDNRTNPFEYQVIEDGKKIKVDMTQIIVENLKRHAIEVLVCTGGDGTLTVAGKLAEAGIKIVAVPKTIDNDIPGTERTFGFDTAVAIATEALKNAFPDYQMHRASTQAIALMMKDLKYISRDVSADIDKNMDYRFLSEATGKPKAALGF